MSERALYDRRSGEENKSDTIALEPLEAVANGKFRPFQPIRRQVLGEHAFRNVEQEYDVAPALFDLLLHHVPGGSRERDHRKCKAGEKQDGLGTAMGRADGRVDVFEQVALGEP